MGIKEGGEVVEGRKRRDVHTFVVEHQQAQNLAQGRKEGVKGVGGEGDRVLVSQTRRVSVRHVKVGREEAGGMRFPPTTMDGTEAGTK
jgi:hypothetical protein